MLFGWHNKYLKSESRVLIICNIVFILVANIYSCSFDGLDTSSIWGCVPLLPFCALFSWANLYWWYWYSICSISLNHIYILYKINKYIKK